jgi:hypothetical protein
VCLNQPDKPPGALFFVEGRVLIKYNGPVGALLAALAPVLSEVLPMLPHGTKKV